MTLFKMLEGTGTTTLYEIKLDSTTSITVVVESATYTKNNVAVMGAGWHHLACTHSSSVAACRYDGDAFAWTTDASSAQEI